MESGVIKCLEVLRTAKSDNEKFAAMYLITKAVKAEDCGDDSRRQLFEALGFDFLDRMLKTTTVPKDCPPHIYKSLALSVLASFSTDNQLACHDHFLNKIPIFLDVLSLENDCGRGEDEDAMFDDSLRCLLAASESLEGRTCLMQCAAMESLCDICSRQSQGRDQVSTVLYHVLLSNGEATWSRHGERLHLLLSHWVQEFIQSQEVIKFEICEKVRQIISTMPKDGDIQTPSWVNPLVNNLYSVLRNKLGPAQREPVLMLSSCVVNSFGVSSILPPHFADPKYVLILVQLTCIEVRMILEDRDIEEVERQSALLCSCYSLLENIIGHMTSGPSMDLAESQMRSIHTAMIGAFNAIIYYLNKMRNQNIPLHSHSLVLASVRTLGSWLAEETSALRDEIYVLLPFLLEICEGSFSSADNSESNATADDCYDMTNTASIIDVMRFLLPGLCHLTAEDHSRGILLSCDAHVLLGKYCRRTWQIFQKKPSDEIKDTLCTVCGIFLNLAVLETDLVSNDEVFKDLLSLCFAASVTIVHDSDLLILSANIVSLGLMLLRHQSHRSDIDEANLGGFLLATITFLSRAHHIRLEGNKMPVLCLGESYRNIWDDIGQLWFLALQAFCACIHENSKVSTVLAKSGWLPLLIKRLLEVKGSNVEKEVEEAYMHFLTAASNGDPAIKQIVKEKRGLDLSRMYRAPDLHRALSS